MIKKQNSYWSEWIETMYQDDALLDQDLVVHTMVA